MTIIPLNQLPGYIWVNGDLIKSQDAKVHIWTHSLHYSGAAFEGERAYNGKIFKLEEHTRRLLASAETLKLQLPFTFDEIIAAHELIVEKNNIIDGYVRPLIFRGSESLNMTNKNLSVILMISAIASVPKFADDLSLHISRWRKPAPDAMPIQCKSSGHYDMMIVAQEEAKALGYNDAILLDWRGYIAECTTTNLFFVEGNELVTPIADAFLNGITRQTIIELAHKLGLTVKEKYLKLEELEKYDESFMTGTAAEIRGIKSIDLGDKKIVFNKDKITKLLYQEYSDLVRR